MLIGTAERTCFQFHSHCHKYQRSFSEVSKIIVISIKDRCHCFKYQRQFLGTFVSINGLTLSGNMHTLVVNWLKETFFINSRIVLKNHIFNSLYFDLHITSKNGFIPFLPQVYLICLYLL